MKSSYLTRRYEALSKKNIDELPLAYIWDRIAAFVLDFLIVGFAANIILSPIKKKIQSAILNEHTGAVNIYVGIIVLSICVLFVAYHTLSISFFKKTIGKKVFNIEVVSIVHGQSLTLYHSLIRACALLVSTVFFFLPLLEVFSNQLRRPMHDRLADTYVKGTLRAGPSPSLVERFWTRVVYAVALANFSVIVLAQFLFLKQDVINISEFVTHPEYLCDEVSEAHGKWQNDEKVSRLDVALALYSANFVGEDCLEKESQRAVSYGEDLDKAYLGKAFVFENQTKISDKYLKKVCQVNAKGEACLLTQIVEMWSKKNWKGVSEVLTKRRVESSFLKIWIVKHYDKVQDYEKLISMIDEMWPNPALNEFIGKYKALTLWKQDKVSESKELFQNIYAALPERRKISFASEICNLEIENGCAVDNGCKILVNQMKNQFSEYTQEDSLLTYIKTNKCGMTSIDDIIVEVRKYIDDPKIQMFLAAVNAQNLGKNKVAEQIYNNILRVSSVSSFLNYEARSNLIDTVDGEAFQEQLDWWLKSDAVGFYHQRLGTKFLKKLSEQKKWSQAEPIAHKLLGSRFIDTEMRELMTVVFYNLKKYSVAKNLIQKEDQRSRSLASIESYERIKKELLKDKK